MKQELVEWASKKIQTATIAGAVVAVTGIGAATGIGAIISQRIPDNCRTVEITTKGTDISMKGIDCVTPSTPPKEKNTLQTLNNLTRLELDLGELFSAGEYSINKKQLLELKKKDSIFRFLAQQRQTLYIKGSADKAGDISFVKSIPNGLDFNQIQLHASSGTSYESKLSSWRINSEFRNSDLPQLRAQSFRHWLEREYPNIRAEIIEGGVESLVGSQYRRVRIFTESRSLINNEVTSIPSSD